jgi:hypothetical protein
MGSQQVMRLQNHNHSDFICGSIRIVSRTSILVFVTLPKYPVPGCAALAPAWSVHVEGRGWLGRFYSERTDLDYFLQENIISKTR